MAYKSEYKVNDDNTVTVGRIAYRPKKISGAKLAAALDEDEYMSKFALWCELTRVVNKPFQQTPKTIATSIIEDEMAAYVRRCSKFSLIQPYMIWGRGYKDVTSCDFFPDNPVFGGMWNGQLKDNSGNLQGIVLFKTTFDIDEWETLPAATKRQAQLYAYLSGTPYYHVAVSFLADKDLDDPQSFRCSNKNTKIIHGKVPEDFRDTLKKAYTWYINNIVDNSVSPKYDEIRDGYYVNEIKTQGQ